MLHENKVKILPQPNEGLIVKTADFGAMAPGKKFMKVN